MTKCPFIEVRLVVANLLLSAIFGTVGLFSAFIAMDRHRRGSGYHNGPISSLGIMLFFIGCVLAAS